MTTRPATAPRSSVRRMPGQPDMWAFVLFEALVFTAYFVVYLLARTQHSAAFLQSQGKLDLRFGTVQTLVLLLSSWSMARCVQASRDGETDVATRDLAITAAFGGLFLASKVIEWIRVAHRGFGITTNEFFSHYYFLTGIHFLHLLIGFVVLGVVAFQLRSPARRSEEVIETCAVYWHTVDLLWVLIFSLLYVVR